MPLSASDTKMSASPSAPPSGRTPNGIAVPPPRPRRPQADPLVRKKPKQPRRLREPAPSKVIPATQVNDTAAVSRTGAAIDASNCDWSKPPGENVKEYPLFTTKRALLEGLRHHVMRFSSKKKDVDPFNEEEFIRPVRLHRRDPRAPPAGAGVASKDSDTPMIDADSKEALLGEQERERLEKIRLEKEAQREADLAQIAPSITKGSAPAQKKKAPKKKTQQVFLNGNSAEQQARTKLRYEEALPWHLEDFENKNTWVGNYEAALSGTYVMLVSTNTSFQMVPIQKWYKFTPKNQFKTLTIEEAEARMGAKVKEPRWFMDAKIKEMRNKQDTIDRQAARGLFTVKREDPNAKPEFGDLGDMDYEEDRFADDEENQLFDGDAEDAKEAEERIKRDQLKANVFNLKEEEDYDKEEELEKKEAELKKTEGKKTRKTLIKQEKNFMYDSESDNNPYSSSSESDDSEDEEAERRKAEEAKKEEERKAAAEKEKAKAKDSEKIPSGASSKGTNTPSGRNKASDPLKLKSSANLKRPGSPNLSEASGTESARKKHKKHEKKNGASSQGTGTPTPLAEMSTVPSSSAPTILTNQQRKTSIVALQVDPTKLQEVISRPTSNKRSRTNPGSGSDGETTDNGGNKRIKIRFGSAASPSPITSRAGSPNPSSSTKPMSNGSRQGSPSASSASNAGLGPPTEADVRAAIPPEGTTVAQLSSLFKARIKDKPSFIAIVKKVAVMGKDKQLVLKPIPGSTPKS